VEAAWEAGVLAAQALAQQGRRPVVGAEEEGGERAEAVARRVEQAGARAGENEGVEGVPGAAVGEAEAAQGAAGEVCSIA